MKTPQTRREFLQKATLGTATLAAAARLSGQSSEAARPAVSERPVRPNLLFLWTDQHRGDAVPWAGDRVLNAPNLKALGERSFCFQRTYCTQPVCTPSRGSIMTGLLPHNHGSYTNNIRLDPAVRTIAEYLPDDTRTAYYGKWHLGDEAFAQHGFDEWKSIEDNYRQYYTDPSKMTTPSDYHRFLVSRGFPPSEIDEDSNQPVFPRSMAAAMREKYTKVSFLANEGEQFIRSQKSGKPWILSVNTLEPHPPTYGPLNELHDPAAMATGPAFNQPPGPGASRLHRETYTAFRKKGYKNHPIDTDDDFRRLKANYYGLITMVDNAYGRILKALEESGQADNTIVVYTSDHGEMLGDHGLMQKSVFYEAAVTVPLAIHVPWLSRERIDFNGPFSQIDLVPTLLELMGQEVPDGLDGVSRAGCLADPSSWKDEDIVVEWNDGSDPTISGRSLVTADGWKLNLYNGDGPELYDLKADPGELTNLASEPAQKERLRRLSRKILTWQAGHGDKLELMA
ncbi:MAG: sulfatase-like hydrolase/transferase [Opitutaceae bacterium]